MATPSATSSAEPTPTATSTVGPTPASQPTPTSSPELTPTPPPAPPGYSVHIATGLNPSWTAEAAADAAYADTKSYERAAGEVLAEAKIIAVRAVAGKDVPNDQFGCCEPRNSVRWIVHAQGTYFNEHEGPAPGRRFFGSDGWYLFDDDGTNLGFSFTELQADLTGLLTSDTGSGCAWLVDEQGTTWQVEWPTGWALTFDTDGTAVILLPDGRRTAISGDTIGVTGSASNQGGSCTAAQKLFAATAIVYLGFH